MNKQTLILKTQIELSVHRVRVIKAFDDKDIIRPMEIAALTGMNINNVSKSLGQLRKMNLVKVIRSEGRARYYGLTAKGKFILDYLD